MQPAGALEGDVFIVARFGLDGRGEDGFGEAAAFGKAGRQRDAADTLLLAVFLPARTGKIATNDTLNGDDLRSADKHRTPAKDVGVPPDGTPHLVHVGGNQVVSACGREAVEPEECECGEHLALERDAGAENEVERRDAVAGNNQERVAQRIDVAHLAAAQECKSLKVGFRNGGGQSHTRT